MRRKRIGMSRSGLHRRRRTFSLLAGRLGDCSSFCACLRSDATSSHALVASTSNSTAAASSFPPAFNTGIGIDQRRNLFLQ